MTDLTTPRLTLHPVDVAEGERIVARAPDEADHWAAGFPGDGDVLAVSAFLRRTAELGEQRPFGFYRVTRTSDGCAVGGIGFKGGPEGGSVEIGYGLVPSARGNGYATEVVTAVLGIAARHGVLRVVAETDPSNLPSRKALERNGFGSRTGEGDVVRYEMVLRDA